MPTLFRIILCLAAVFFAFKSNSQEELHNHVFDKNIYTVQLEVNQVEMSEPIIPLNGNLQLVLSFDELGEEASGYSYQIYHCNRDWTLSQLRPQECINGFWKSPITNFDFSFNTIVPYTHYTFTFPNNNLSFTRSGNYIIQVFRSDNPQVIALQARFVVYEESVNVVARVKQPDRMWVRNTHQEVDFTVVHNGLPIAANPMAISATILKNGSWTDAIYNLEPRFTRKDESVFDYDTNNLFYGGNEYRYFDLRDISYTSERVYRIDKEKTPFFAQLYRDIDRSNQNYSDYRDLNGGFLIDNQQGVTAELDADYLDVFFSIPADFPLNEGSVLVDGKISLGYHDKRYEMTYNKSRHQYELTVPVKQGFYAYRYVFSEVDYPVQPYKEGSYWQTENQYHICVYYRGLIDEADRVIGYTSVNSILN